ncbi:MAG: phosphatidate cytidylyltransferase [Candidatus Desulforudaceae bacterium]
MGTRILTALIGTPVALLAGWFGGLPLLVATGLLVLVAQSEMVRLLRDLRPHRGMVFTGGLILIAAAYVFGERFPGPGFVGVLALVLGAMVFFYPRFSPQVVAGTLTAVFYPALLLYLFLVRGLPDGWVWLLILLFGTWAFDTFGYLVGVKLGRIRITPELSPKKSLEGLLGGIVGTVLIVQAFGYFLFGGFSYDLLLLGVALALVAQAGDLVASAFKRPAGAKDSGNLLPGHGCVLDRFDSLIFTAPLVYHFVVVFRMT